MNKNGKHYGRDENEKKDAGTSVGIILAGVDGNDHWGGGWDSHYIGDEGRIKVWQGDSANCGELFCRDYVGVCVGGSAGFGGGVCGLVAPVFWRESGDLAV